MVSKKILLMGILAFSPLFAESKILFALNNQYFSETLPKEKSEKPKDGSMISARYDVGDVIVSTNLAMLASGTLGAPLRHNNGYLVVDVKEPVKQWNVSMSVSYAFYGNCKGGGETKAYSIRLGANNGESVYITTNNCDVVVNNTQIILSKDEGLNGVHMDYFAKTEGDNIVVMLNGQQLVKFPKGDFDKLKTVELGLGRSEDLYAASHIKNLTIGEK